MSPSNSESKGWTLAELAEQLGGRAIGNADTSVTRADVLEHATADSISHCSTPAQEKFLDSTDAGIVIVPEDRHAIYAGDRIVAKNARLAFAKAVDILHAPAPVNPGIDRTALIHPSAVIAESAAIDANVVIGENAQIGRGVHIGAGTVVGDSVVVGEGTHIACNVSIYSGCVIGQQCQIFAGVVLGASGFSYEREDDRWHAIRNIGRVVIGDEVDIGACTTIDRGSIRDTVIGDGVKIDNNVQIGHNVEVGEHTLIVGNVGIAGSVRVGKRCILGGQVAIASHVEIVDDVVVQASSLVTKSIAVPGTYSGSVPAREVTLWQRTLANMYRLGRHKPSASRQSQ